MKRRDLIKHLREHGCVLQEHGSKHDMWLNPRTNMQTTVPRHREIPTPTGRGICKQLGIPLIRAR